VPLQPLPVLCAHPKSHVTRGGQADAQSIVDAAHEICP
jgi:organic hydroperoxide reductase OsmC/OhrA